MADTIAQFTSPLNKIQPSETGAEALARVGRIEKENISQEGEAYSHAISDVGNKIDKYETLQEISQGSAALAVMHNNLTQAWNKTATNTDPNDNTVQEKFMESANNQLDQWKNSFDTSRGQQWAESQADSMRSHMWDKTSADMGTRAGNAIVGNLKTTLTNLSATAKADPSTIDSSLSHVDQLVAAAKEHSSGFLGSAEVGRIDEISANMKNEIVKSGIIGMADKDPQAALNLINSGVAKDHVSGAEAEQLTRYAEGVTRMKQEDQHRAEEEKTRQQKMVDEQATDKIINGMYNQDTGQLSIPKDISQQIWQMQGVSGETKMKILGAVKRMSQEDNIDDPNIVRQFANRLMSNSSNPLSQDDLLGAMANGHLTPSTFNFFNGKLDDTPDGITAKESLAKAMRDAEDKLSTTLYGSGTLSIPGDINKQIMGMPGIGGKEKLELINKVGTLSNKTSGEDQTTISGFADRLKSDTTNPLSANDLDEALSTNKINKSTYNFFNSKLSDTAKGKTSDNEDVVQNFASRLQSDTTQPLTKKDIISAMAQGDITKSTFNFFEKQLETTTYQKPKDNSPGMLSSAYQRFQSWFLPAYQTASKDPSLNSLSEGQKAQTLLNPSSKQYMLNEDNMKQFKTNGDDIIKDAIPPVKASELDNSVPPPGSPNRATWVKQQLLNGL